MSILAAFANGNLTAAGTWELIDVTSYLNSETAAHVITTAYAGTTSANFTPGAITIDGIAVKLAVRTGTTGTITVHLEIATVEVAGTAVTINCSDLPVAATADLNGGWIFFKFAAPVLLVGATVYNVAVKTSSAAQVSLFRDSTAGNISRYLRTTTTQAPVAGDDMIITKEWTAAATGTARTVTMDSTAATDYGSATTSQVTPAIAVCQGGTFTYGVAGATNYVLRLSGCVVIYSAGTFNIGAVGTEIPRTSTAVLEFDCAADGDFGLVCRNLGTFNSAGLSRTSGKNVVKTLLNADAAIAATTLTVVADTGWLSGDQIAVAATGQYTGDGSQQRSELGALNGNAGASSLTVSGGLNWAHSGSSGSFVSPVGVTINWSTQAEIILLTRNVKVRSTLSTAMAYVYAAATATVAISWTEIYYIGENVAGKRGIETDTTTGSFSLTLSSVHDCEDFGLYIGASQAAWGNTTIQEVVMWNVATITGPAISLPTATTQTSWTLDNVWIIKTATGSNGYSMRSVKGTFTNIRVVDSQDACEIIAANESMGTWGPLVFHSNTRFGLRFSSSGCTGSISGLYLYRNSSTAFLMSAACVDLTIDPYISHGNVASCTLQDGGTMNIKNGMVAGETTYTTPSCFVVDYQSYRVNAYNMAFSPTSGIFVPVTTADLIQQNQWGEPVFVLQNCSLGCPSQVTNTLFLTPSGYFAVQRRGGVVGDHRTWLAAGVLFPDTVYFNTASPSMRMNPISASVKLPSSPKSQERGMRVAVVNGVAPTVSVYVRKSAALDISASITATITGATTLTVTAMSPFCGFIRPGDTITGTGVAGSTVVQAYGTGNGDLGTYTLNGNQAISSRAMSVIGQAYNGNQPRLICRANAALGLSSDTVIATASGATGTWELLSGVLPTPTDDGAFELFVDCDGITGWINVDDWAVTVSPALGGQNYWFDGLPIGIIAANSGGGHIIGG